MKEERNPFVQIAASLGGISVGIIALLVIFAREYAWVAIFVVLGLALLGIFLGNQQKQVLLAGKKK